MIAHAYDVFHGEVDARRGRVFFRPGALTAEEAGALLEHSLHDSEDLERLNLLGNVLDQRLVAIFATHRTLDAPDVIQTFLRTDLDGRAATVFACTVYSLARIERDLEQEGFVVEGPTLQVGSTAAVTHASLEAALHAWCERMFPDLRTPRIVLDPWQYEVEDPDPAFVEMVIRNTKPVDQAMAANHGNGLAFSPPATLTDDSVRETAA